MTKFIICIMTSMKGIVGECIYLYQFVFISTEPELTNTVIYVSHVLLLHIHKLENKAKNAIELFSPPTLLFLSNDE